MVLEHPDCRDVSDADLVARILEARDTAQRQTYCQALFWRYYDRFDLWVREVLAAYNKTYSDQTRYYEEVFQRIYLAVFDPAAFARLLRTFDPERRFFPWLRQVVRHRAIDWVRAQGIKPLEVPAERLVDRRAPVPPAPEVAEPFVARLNELPDHERLSVRLALLAYLDLDPVDLRALSERRGEPVETIRREAADLRDRLRETPAYRASLEAEDALGVLEYQVRVSERRCARMRERISEQGLSPGAVAALEDEAQRLHLSDLQVSARVPRPVLPGRARRDETRRGTRDAAEAGSLAAEAAAFQEAVIRLGRLRRRLAEEREAVRRGRHLVRASYRQVARIMGVKETDVTNFLHRARKGLSGIAADS